MGPHRLCPVEHAAVQSHQREYFTNIDNSQYFVFIIIPALKLIVTISSEKFPNLFGTACESYELSFSYFASTLPLETSVFLFSEKLVRSIEGLFWKSEKSFSSDFTGPGVLRGDVF